MIDATTNPPATAPLSTVIRTGVTLTRQSSKRTDSKYNFYLEAPVVLPSSQATWLRC
ncbi:MAG: hypothetical protein WBS54_02425 [Acidobacteriota bacterium]